MQPNTTASAFRFLFCYTYNFSLSLNNWPKILSSGARDTAQLRARAVLPEESGVQFPAPGWPEPTV